MKFYIETFGCKVNLYESNYLKSSLISDGFIYVNNFVLADIIIINTCTVTNKADNKCLKFIRRVKRENKNSVLVVIGCSVQNNLEEYKKMAIDILLGNSKKIELVKIIRKYLKDKQKYCYVNNNRNLEFENMQITDFNHARAFIKIEDGCDNFCSYCIIPFVRGSVRCKDFNLIIKEANNLVANNHQEIVLTGINIGKYNNSNKDLVDLINELAKIDQLKRIRLSSIEVTEINDKFIDMLKTNNKFCNHLHIPLQSGSNKILSLMNRKYNIEYFINKINKIREIRKDISITTDIIVGFPEETENDFNQTYANAKKIKFSKIHVFPYSKRNKTSSCSLKEVKSEEKTNRVHKLLELSKILEKEYQDKFVNKEVDVLIEEVKNNKSFGTTSNYLKVSIPKILKRNDIYKIIYK